jgi:hypothetical protein
MLLTGKSGGAKEGVLRALAAVAKVRKTVER